MKTCLTSLVVREMKIKIMVTPIRMGEIKKKSTPPVIDKELGTLVHHWWEYKKVQPLWN